MALLQPLTIFRGPLTTPMIKDPLAREKESIVPSTFKKISLLKGGGALSLLYKSAFLISNCTPKILSGPL